MFGTTYYHTDVYIYIYEIKYFLWFPTEFKEYNIVYMILLPIDGMKVHWQCTTPNTPNTVGDKL
jgi:hypothetical protein